MKVPSRNTCVEASTLNNSIANCGNQEQDSQGTITCKSCLKGFSLTSTGCAPCPVGCEVCPTNLNVCSKCEPGWSLDASNICVQNGLACSKGCTDCLGGGLGCSKCEDGFVLNQNWECQRPCETPCATCSATDPHVCKSCVLGYILNGTTCLFDTSCNANNDCRTCPANFILETNSSAGPFSRFCKGCNVSANCYRCESINFSKCTSCLEGFFLDSNRTCISCPSSCSNCINSNFCV